jgi:unsaturated rhamnogalacturonyl hydrolase
MTTGLDVAVLKETAERVFHYMIIEHSGDLALQSSVDVDSPHWGMDIDQWNWNPGVGVTCISNYYDISKQPHILDYLKGWVDRNQTKMRKFQHVNVMAPFAIFPDMYRRTNNQFFLDTAVEYSSWIVQNSARTMTGALQHGGDLTEQIWADTIFMAVLFLARTARLTGDKALAAEAANQLLLHLQYLQDPETGVLFHGYFCDDKSHHSSARWTRGNAWITVGTPLILSEIKNLIEVPAEITQRYQQLVDGLLRFQAANGMWHTVMDQPSFYQETSGSSGIACGILKAIHLGLLPKEKYLPAVEKAIAGILTMIGPDGKVASVSGGTPIMNTVEEYSRLSRYPTLYGQGLTLILLAEYSYR